MRKWVFYITVSGLVILFLFIFSYMIPTKINKTFEGVLYQLGMENTNIEEKLQIKINGVIKRGLFGDKTFQGTLKIGNEQIPPENARDTEIEIELLKGNAYGGSIIYIDDEKDLIINYGTIYEINNFEKFTIILYEQSGSTGGGWSSEDSTVISVPASNREEALSITKKLLNFDRME